MENKKLEYSVPKKHKRFLANLIDLFCIGFTTFLLFALSNMIVNEMPSYKAELQTRHKIQIDSGLYAEDGTDIVTYVNSDEVNFVTTEEKKNYLKDKIDEFYNNPYFFNLDNNTAKKEYDERKLNASSEGVMLFVMDNNNIIENNVNPELLYTFYQSEIQDYCLGYFLYNDAYLNTTKTITIVTFLQILIDLTISVIIFYLIFPLTFFRRGRLTFGRCVFKIGLIAKNALNVTWGKFVLRFIFVYFVYFIVSFVSLLIPIFVSFSMQFFSKRGQNLVDYVLNQYMVDITTEEIYLNYGDYVSRKDLKNNAKLENNRLKLR